MTEETTGGRMSRPHKVPKTISEEDEKRMDIDADRQIAWLAERYPKARPIDVLNSYLRVFIDRAEALRERRVYE